jgi:hypothetical protein
MTGGARPSAFAGRRAAGRGCWAALGQLGLEVAGELLLQLVPRVDRVLVQRLEPCEWGLVQTEGEVEALGVIVAARVLDGEGVAPEPLNGILLRVVLGDPRGLNLSGRSKLRSRGEKAEKPSLSPAVANFFRRSSSIFWRAS